MRAKFTGKSNFRGVEAVYHSQAIFFGYLNTLIIEFLALIAPATFIGSFIYDLLDRNKESMCVDTVEFESIFALTYAKVCWKAFSIVLLGKILSKLKDWRLRLLISRFIIWCTGSCTCCCRYLYKRCEYHRHVRLYWLRVLLQKLKITFVQEAFIKIWGALARRGSQFTVHTLSSCQSLIRLIFHILNSNGWADIKLGGTWSRTFLILFGLNFSWDDFLALRDFLDFFFTANSPT